MLFKTALRLRLTVLIACLLFGTVGTWADVPYYTFAAWDETTGTLYFDSTSYFLDVGNTFTAINGETVTISKIWWEDQVVETGNSVPGWNTSDIRNACTKVVIGILGDRIPKSCYQWFYGFNNLTTIEGLSNLDTEYATTMYGMFMGCSKLTSLDLIGLDTQNVTNMNYMFWGCSQLETLYLSTFNTSKVQGMQGMFSGCTKLKTIYVDENLWTTANVKDGNMMFSDCTSLKGGKGYAYNEANTGKAYAHVDKSDNRGYLTAGAVFAGWNESNKKLTFGFGEVPKTNTLTDEGIFTQVWYGQEALNGSWKSVVRSTCTTVRFASSFTVNVKGMSMNQWFYDFSNLETVERFDYVTPGRTYSMFCYCSKLSSISLPSTLKRISQYMFLDCSSLPKLFIPMGVTSIGRKAFNGCTSLSAFTVSTSNTCFKAEDGVLFTADKKGLVAYPAGKTATKYTIPNGVERISDEAFYKNKYLTSVILPSSVSEIGDDAFAYCDALTSMRVNMLEPPTIIYNPFYGTADHATLDVPHGCKDVYKNANVWKDFKSIYEYDETYAIWDATTKTLYFDEDYQQNTTIPVVGSTWQTSLDKTITVTKIWSGDEVLNTQGFPGWSEVAGECEKVSIESWGIVPESCYGWFINFKKLKSIDGLDRLETSEVTDMSYMFAGCSELTLKQNDLLRFFPENVVSMAYMFYGCSKMTELYLEAFNTNNVKNMTGMFSNCPNLKAIYVDADLWNTQQVTTGDNMFDGCTSLKGGNGTAFSSANNGLGYARVDKAGAPGYLTAGVMFAVWCEGNSTLSFDFGTPPAVGNKYGGTTASDVMKGHSIIACAYHDVLMWEDYDKTCTRVVFTNSFAEHAKGLSMHWWFGGFSKLTLVQGFENVEVGSTYSTFGLCQNLSSITLQASLTRIGEGMFQKCSSLPSIVIPDGVTAIGEKAFFGCESLTSINIPKGVTTIGKEAFSGCTSLTAFNVTAGNIHYISVDGVLFTADKTTLLAYPLGKTAKEYTVPSGVQRMGANAFEGNPYLTSVILPASLIAIDDFAFYMSWSLESVKVFAKTPPILAMKTFDCIANDATLYVPKGCKAAYEASGWREYFNQVVEFATPGDANGDGKVDIVDVTMTISQILGQHPAGFDKDAADVTGDGKIDIVDVTSIIDIILSK